MVVLHLETDASCNYGRTQPRPGLSPLVYAGVGVVIRTEDLRLISLHSIRLGFVPSTDYAEYLGFLNGMVLARKHGASGLLARSDLLSLVRQVNGDEVHGGEGIPALMGRIEELKTGLDPFKLRWARSTHHHHRRDGVPTADLLAKRASGVPVPRLSWRTSRR